MPVTCSLRLRTHLLSSMSSRRWGKGGPHIWVGRIHRSSNEDSWGRTEVWQYQARENPGANSRWRPWNACLAISKGGKSHHHSFQNKLLTDSKEFFKVSSKSRENKCHSFLSFDVSVYCFTPCLNINFCVHCYYCILSYCFYHLLFNTDMILMYIDSLAGLRKELKRLPISKVCLMMGLNLNKSTL